MILISCALNFLCLSKYGILYSILTYTVIPTNANTIIIPLFKIQYCSCWQFTYFRVVYWYNGRMILVFGEKLTCNAC